MKQCPSCNITKDKSEFYKQNDRTSGSSYCKSCFNTYCIQRWADRKIKAVKYKGGKCKKCGYSKHPSALHFHHRDPLKKVAVWTKMRLWSWDKTLIELDKCDMLCSNCHAEEHWS